MDMNMDLNDNENGQDMVMDMDMDNFCKNCNQLTMPVCNLVLR